MEVKCLLFPLYLGNGSSDFVQTFSTACPNIFSNFLCRFRVGKKIFSYEKWCVNSKIWSTFCKNRSLAPISFFWPVPSWLNFVHLWSDSWRTFWCKIYQKILIFTVWIFRFYFRNWWNVAENSSFSTISLLYISWSRSNVTHVFSQVISSDWCGFRFRDIDISKKNECQSCVFCVFSRIVFST
jgi:hypothetical protein